MSPKDIEAMKRDYCPVYIVGCPELHPLPKRLLEEKLKGDPTALEVCELLRLHRILNLDGYLKIMSYFG